MFSTITILYNAEKVDARISSSSSRRLYSGILMPRVTTTNLLTNYLLGVINQCSGNQERYLHVEGPWDQTHAPCTITIGIPTSTTNS